MNIKIKFLSFGLLCFVVIAVSCSTDNNQVANKVQNPPAPAKLVYPENNTECNEGTIVSDTETDVLFQWEDSINTSSYILNITNLNNGNTREIKTDSNQFLIRILRGTPYSWYVKSKAIVGNETANSETWKFYNAGLPEESHPPFPANVISPTIGSTIDPGSITLKWESTDVDNDIASYRVLLDTSNVPVTEVGNLSENNLVVVVESGKIYYWQVITIDNQGNESHSQTFQFRVN